MEGERGYGVAGETTGRSGFGVETSGLFGCVGVVPPLERAGGQALACSLLEVTIKTGRTHQIRVHLASASHPILGDDKYGDFELNKMLLRSAA